MTDQEVLQAFEKHIEAHLQIEPLNGGYRFYFGHGTWTGSKQQIKESVMSNLNMVTLFRDLLKEWYPEKFTNNTVVVNFDPNPYIKEGDRVRRRKINAFRYQTEKEGTVVKITNGIFCKIKWDVKASNGQQHSTIQRRFLEKIDFSKK